MALATGMRQGELLALHWRDVDMDQGQIQVRGTLQLNGIIAEPKTSKSCRQITLPAFAEESLKRHRVRPNEERLSTGPAWTDLVLVFTNIVGKHLYGNHLRNRAFPKLLERSGVPRIRFHDSRHRAATLLLSLGAHTKVVQELLGHSQISVTLDTYSHILPNMQREAMVEMDALLAQ